MATQEGPLDGHRRPGTKDREPSVAGSLSDMGVADLVQTLEMGKKSGVLHLKARGGARAACHFRNGQVVDCELDGAPRGEEAFYRILRWHEGGFAIEFKPSDREERIQLPTPALLLQGMRRIDEWRRVVDQLPPLERRLEVDVARLGERLSELPDVANGLLRLFDGRRTLAQVIEAAPGGELAAAETVSRLVAEGILSDGGSAEGAPTAAPPEPVHLDAPAPPLLDPAPEAGGVDWFAGPVGPEAPVAPALSWGVTFSEARPPPSPEGGGDWLEPPLPEPPSPPRRAPRAAPPRAAVRFSIPVPPPGTLPPPPSVAETLARYRVVPRPVKAPDAVAVGAASQGEPAPTPPPAAPATAAPAMIAPPPAPAAAGPYEASAASPAVAPPPPAEHLAGAPVPAVAAPAPRTPRAAATAAARGPGAAGPRSRPFDAGSEPLHLGAPPASARPPAAPRRSALPYLVVGGLVVAAIGAGALLARRPPQPAAAQAAARPSAPVAAPSPEQAAPPAERDAPTAPAPPPAPAAPRAAPPTPAAVAVQPAAAPADAEARQVATAPSRDVRTGSAPSRPAAVTTAASAPVPAPTPEEADATTLLAAAERKYRAGRYAEAIAEYRRAVALRPTPAARVGLARALYDGNRSDEALRELDQVIAANPRDASAWLLRADIHQGEGRPEEARAAYRRFLELEPQGEQARVVRMILGRDLQ